MPYKNKEYYKLRDGYHKSYWQENKDRYSEQRHIRRLGTSDFSEHRLEDSDKEYEAIQKEKQRIQKQYMEPSWRSYWLNDKYQIEDNISILHKHAIVDFVPKIIKDI